ncbi:hypothetical protein ABH935_006678 [Catenulispora sp. GAS73]
MAQGNLWATITAVSGAVTPTKGNREIRAGQFGSVLAW